MDPTMHDPVTLLHVAARDPAALGRLVEAEQPQLLAWLSRVLRDADLAQEAAQEAWLILQRGEWRFAARSADAVGDLRAWLRQVALRSALRLRQRQDAQRRVLGRWFRQHPPAPDAPTPLERLAQEDAHAVLRAVVATLPEPQRVALELRFHAGLDFAAIGRAQGCTALTARVRTWRALASLRRRLLSLGFLLLSSTLAAAGAEEAAPMSQSSCGRSDAIGAVARGAGGMPLALAGAALLAFVVASAWWFALAGDTGESSPVQGFSSSTSAPDGPGIDPMVQPWTMRRPVIGAESPPHVPQHTVTGEDLILVEMHILVPGDTALAPPSPSPWLLDATQRQALIAGAHQVLTQPRLLTLSGESAHLGIGGRREYTAGFQAADDGWKAVREEVEEGVISIIRLEAASNGTRVRGLTTTRTDVLELHDRLASADIRQDLRWQEARVLRSQVDEPPVDGWFIPAGRSLLLPVSRGTVEHRRSDGVSSHPAADFTPWWLVVTPTVQPRSEDPEPASPSSRG